MRRPEQAASCRNLPSAIAIPSKLRDFLRHALTAKRAAAGAARWNQARYFVIFARCADGACRLHVDASSLLAGAPHRSSTQSFGLYAISSSAARSSTSLSASVHCGAVAARIGEPARRKLRGEHALQFGLHVGDAFPLRHGVALGPPRDAIRKSAHHIDRDQEAQIARRRGEILPRADRLEDRRAVRHGRLAAPAVLELSPVLDRRDARPSLALRAT